MKSYPVVSSPHPVTARHNSEQQLLYLIHISKLLRFKKTGYIWYIFIYIDKKRKTSDIYILISSTVVLPYTVFNLRKG